MSKAWKFFLSGSRERHTDFVNYVNKAISTGDRLQSRVHVAAGLGVEVRHELLSAMERYPAMNSAHEGFAILKEEVDELWEEVKRKPNRVSRKAMRKEAIQVAAMAMRFVLDVCDKEQK